MNKHLVLIGMMGSGKTTVGRWIEAKRGLPLYDIDALIERREGRSIRELFAAEGEPYFRQRERELTVETVGNEPGVIATGGGLFVDSENRRLLREHGVVFYLHAAGEELMARLAGATNRPLLPSLLALLEQREPVYRQAHHTIDVGQRKVKEIGEEILRLYEREHL